MHDDRGTPQGKRDPIIFLWYVTRYLVAVQWYGLYGTGKGHPVSYSCWRLNPYFILPFCEVSDLPVVWNPSAGSAPATGKADRYRAPGTELMSEGRAEPNPQLGMINVSP